MFWSSRRRVKIERMDGLALLLYLRRRRKKREYVRYAHCILGYQRKLAFNIYFHRSMDLHRYCHFSIESFNSLFNQIGGHLDHEKRHRWPINAQKRLLIFLRYLATGLSLDQLAHEFLIGKSTAAAIVWEVCGVILKRLGAIYLKPPSLEDLLKNAQEFETKFGFPRAVGALDGKHVRIMRPPNSGTCFYNYKKYYSIVLLAVVDASYRFMMIDVGGEGNLSDATLFDDSELKSYLDHIGLPEPMPLGNVGSVPFVLLADGGFGLAHNIMTPFRTVSLNSDGRIAFNKRVSSARQCVENSFGQLVAHFGVFSKAIAASVERCRDLTTAAVILHNFLKSADVDEHQASMHPPFDVSDIQRMDSVAPEHRNTNAERLRLKVYRERFTEYFSL